MKFTAIMFGVPILLMLMSSKGPPQDTFGLVGSVWFFLSIPTVLLYWLTRVVRRAWRDGTRRGEA